MTDGESTAVIAVAISAAGGAIGHSIRWAIGRWSTAMDRVANEMFEMRVMNAAICEQDRIRSNRRKRDSEGPPLRGRPAQPQAVPIEIAEETTDIIVLAERMRETLKPTKPRGERKPRPGTHHDE